ncbi:hypothetical protein Sjap_025860 [Stephania japonica]|uniref:Uncharacterized protein n=1 Tax=Stephania japonica TaxID=461633 RepID=A0AAP0EAB1_9MAGN
MISKMILSSNSLGCSEEIITIAAVLSIQSIWVSSRGIQKELDEAKLRFAAAEKKVIEIREQLSKIVQRLGMVLKSCDRDTQVLRKAITAGFFANACCLERSFDIALRIMYKIYTAQQLVDLVIKLEIISNCGFRLVESIHEHESVNIAIDKPCGDGPMVRVNPKWVLYHSIVSTDRLYMRNPILVSQTNQTCLHAADDEPRLLNLKVVVTLFARNSITISSFNCGELELHGGQHLSALLHCGHIQSKCKVLSDAKLPIDGLNGKEPWKYNVEQIHGDIEELTDGRGTFFGHVSILQGEQ